MSCNVKNRMWKENLDSGVQEKKTIVTNNIAVKNSGNPGMTIQKFWNQSISMFGNPRPQHQSNCFVVI